MARGLRAHPAPAPARVLPDVLQRCWLKQRPSPVLTAIRQQQQPRGPGPGREMPRSRRLPPVGRVRPFQQEDATRVPG